MDDLTQSPNLGVRWQAQMEEHLKTMRMYSNSAGRGGAHMADGWVVSQSNLAVAHSIAALTLAIVNSIGDAERVLDRVIETVTPAIEQYVEDHSFNGE